VWAATRLAPVLFERCVVEMVRNFAVSGPLQIFQMFQTHNANKQAEIANQLTKIAIENANQQAVIANILIGIFVASVIYVIYVVRRYFIKVRHSALSTIFFQSLTHFAHFPKQQKLDV
jgi:hypothetical protein